ncbi:hypothetical protein HW555_001147 [Spodoptera exigua]|uniref:PA domain-containing protein n=1 Tax=Spodoptera exigua TaxID=7107 RepID=A0A835GQN0_SPOEX|nr:hypothetical protein HW555_001147 [Spodoptera exigua]
MPSEANDLHFHDGVSTADIIYGDVFFEILDPPELRYSYRIRPAKDFGTPFNESIQFHDARLVPTKPLHSCVDLTNQDDIVGQIALSERGGCSFVFKTAKAQQAGARAIIITEMDLDVNIPAAYLLGRSGTTILRTLRKLKKDYAIVNLPINLTHVPIGKMNQPPWISWVL